MGGSIAIAARFNDGQAICIEGWTNFIPAMVMNDTTLSGDDRIVRETLLKAAAVEHYGGPVQLRKSGYGIVVLDFPSREIHSIQGYTSFTRRMLGQLVDINASGWKDGRFENVLSGEGSSLIDAGRVRAEGEDGPEGEPYDRERVLAELRQDHEEFMAGGSMGYRPIVVDASPFVVHDHGEDASFNPVKEHLRGKGFPTTRKQGLNEMLAGISREMAP